MIILSMLFELILSLLLLYPSLLLLLEFNDVSLGLYNVKQIYHYQKQLMKMTKMKISTIMKG